jgi:hypothetical protein
VGLLGLGWVGSEVIAHPFEIYYVPRGTAITLGSVQFVLSSVGTVPLNPHVRLCKVPRNC